MSGVVEEEAGRAGAGGVEFPGGGGMRRVPDGGAVAVPGLDVCWALLEYDGAARHLVAGLKYRNDRRRLAWVAEGMARLVHPRADAVVTWVPTTAARRRARGFDQAELLARAVARRWRRPCRRLLARSSAPPQTGRDREERLAAGSGGVLFRPVRRSVGDAPVLLVDDVVTTGATLSAASRAGGRPVPPGWRRPSPLAPPGL